MAALTQEALDEIDIVPSTLDDALKALNDLYKIADAGLDRIKELAEKNSNLEDLVDEAQSELEDAKDERDAALETAINDLEAVRQMIKAGRYDEATHVLDRLLQESDPTCKRVATVVLPVHGGGFL